MSMDADATEVIILPEETTEEVDNTSSKQLITVDAILNRINEKLSLDSNLKQNVSTLVGDNVEWLEFLQIIDQQLEDKIEDEKLVENLKLYNEELKSQKVELEINFEQKSHNFEKRNEELLIEAKKFKDLVDTTKKENIEKDEQFTEMKRKFNDAQTKLIKAKQEMITIKANNDRTEAEKRDLMSVIDKKTAEIESSNEEYEKLLNTLHKTKDELYEVNKQLSTLQNNETSARFNEQRYRQEYDILKKQNEWQNEQLKKKNEEFLQYKQQKDKDIKQLQDNFDSSNNERERLDKSYRLLQKQYEEQKDKINELIVKYNDSENKIILSESRFKNELDSQIKLVEMYKNRSEMLKEKLKESKGLVAQMESVYNNKLDKLQKEYDKCENEKQQLLLQVKEIQENNPTALGSLSLDQSLSSENQNMSFLSPTAMATSQLMRSGKTFTEVYAEYAKLQDILRREKENNERLAECLSSVQKEIDERAPILQQQREDYEKTLAENEELASNLSLVSKECENQKSEIESKDKKLASVKREYDILKQENEDLSRQIVAIMVEQHGIGESGEFEYSASTDSEAVINEKLVIAKNVEELHQQNKKLLMVVRELTAKQEELENELEASKDNTTAEELMEARQVIEGLQESQRNFENRIDACLKERDMWKRMAEKGGTTENVIQLQKVIDPTINSKLEIKYRELQKDFDIYRKEMETNQEILNNNLENARKSVSDIRTTLAKKESQIDYIKEQNLLNKTECEKLRSEASSLREQNSHLSGIITAHEQNISEMTNQLAGLKEENKNLTFKYGTLQQEKEAMSMLTERLKNENRELSEQKTKMDSLMDSIHNLQTCMDMNQFEGRKRLVANNKKLEEELDDYKKKLEAQQQETKEVIAKKEKDLEILSSKYNTLLQDHHAIREKMIVSDTSINDLNRKVEEMTQELKQLFVGNLFTNGLVHFMKVPLLNY